MADQEHWWCRVHNREATGLHKGRHRCAPGLGGILIPCEAVAWNGVTPPIKAPPKPDHYRSVNGLWRPLSAVAIMLVAGIALLLSSADLAQADTPVTAGGWTDEACTGQAQNTPLVVTASSAYTANNEVGPLLALQFARTSPGTPASSGILQSVTLTSKSVQTAEFDISLFVAKPTASTWTDKTGPAIAAADIPLVRYPVKLTNAFSGLGTHTVYNQDQIARAVELQPSASGLIYAIITTTGTPTFTTTTDLQLCIGMLKD